MVYLLTYSYAGYVFFNVKLMHLFLMFSGQGTCDNERSHNSKLVDLFPVGAEKCRKVGAKTMVDRAAPQQAPEPSGDPQNNALLLPIQGK